MRQYDQLSRHNQSEPKSTLAAIYLIPAMMSVIALATLPYGYYQLLRLVVTGSAALIVWQGIERGDRTAPVLFTLIALLFNPVFRIHLDREQWAVLNVMVAALYLAAFMRGWRSSRRL